MQVLLILLLNNLQLPLIAEKYNEGLYVLVHKHDEIIRDIFQS